MPRWEELNHRERDRLGFRTARPEALLGGTTDSRNGQQILGEQESGSKDQGRWSPVHVAPRGTAGEGARASSQARRLGHSVLLERSRGLARKGGPAGRGV